MLVLSQPLKMILDKNHYHFLSINWLSTNWNMSPDNFNIIFYDTIFDNLSNIFYFFIITSKISQEDHPIVLYHDVTIINLSLIRREK